MTEPEENEDLVTFDEVMENIEKEREERRKQVPYEWVETVREAGELYREIEDTEIVAERLSLSEESAREALIVYRLIFEDTPRDVASKAFTTGQAFFSLQRDSIERTDEDEEEPVEDLLREFVGAVYLEQKISEEPVGDPPSETTPQMLIDSEKLSEIVDSASVTKALSPTAGGLGRLGGVERALTQGLDLGFNPEDVLPSSGIAPALVRPEDVMPSSSIIDAALIDPEDVLPSSGIASALIRPEDVLPSSSIIDAAGMTGEVGRMFSAWQPATELIVNSLIDVALPSSLVADLAAIEPNIGAITTGELSRREPLPRKNWGDGTTTEQGGTNMQTETVRAPSETVSTSIPVELILDTSESIIGSMFGPKEVRTWFSELPEEYQDAIIGMILFSVALSLTGNMATAGVVSLISPAIKKAIIED